MITYSLACSHGHEFEGWFKDSATYNAQEADGSLVCPTCGDSGIRKAIMAPSLLKSEPGQIAGQAGESVRQYAAGMRKFIREHAEYVGPAFAEEARNIHYGESKERHIFGEASRTEVSELLDEGIAVAPFPVDPEDLN